MTPPSHRKRGPAPLVAPCPPGEFARLSQRLRGRRQRRVFLRTAALGTVLATGGCLALWLALGEPDEPMPREPLYGGLTCSEVRQLAGAYERGELSAPVQEQVRQHLAQCPHCRAAFQSPDTSG